MLERIDQIFVFLKAHLLGLIGLTGAYKELTSMVVNMVVLLVVAPLTMMYLTWLERKVIARFQDRWGPNRVGPFGLLQPVADGIKMFMKEDITPTIADKLLHITAPVLIVLPALMIFAIIPFGRNMLGDDLNIGLLFFIAIAALETVAVVMAGWGSRSKYALLGAMRGAAQAFSYEVPMALSLITVIMWVGSLSTRAVVEAQGAWWGMQWFIFRPWGLLGFFLFLTAGIAEVNRTPFDLLEGESEIVAGYHTEYSGMKWALFQMAEFLGAFAVSGMTVTLFLGGWQGPVLPSWLWFFLKVLVVQSCLVWLRGTFPRFRIDQVMNFSWKFLLPLSLANIFVVAVDWYVPGVVGYVLSWALLLIFFFAVWAVNSKKAARPYEASQQHAIA